MSETHLDFEDHIEETPGACVINCDNAATCKFLQEFYPAKPEAEQYYIIHDKRVDVYYFWYNIFTSHRNEYGLIATIEFKDETQLDKFKSICNGEFLNQRVAEFVKNINNTAKIVEICSACLREVVGDKAQFLNIDAIVTASMPNILRQIYICGIGNRNTNDTVTENHDEFLWKFFPVLQKLYIGEYQKIPLIYINMLTSMARH